MTRDEYEAWKKHTKTCNYNWVSDPIVESKGEFLFHLGGENGRFVRIDPTGKVELGTYEGAIPHIGEALFRVQGTKQFANQEEALTRAIEAGGTAFLLDFLGIPAYPKHV